MYVIDETFYSSCISTHECSLEIVEARVFILESLTRVHFFNNAALLVDPALNEQIIHAYVANYLYLYHNFCYICIFFLLKT